MDIKAANAAIALVPQIEALAKLIAGIELAIAEKWPVSTLKAWAPENSTQSLHTEIDLLVGHEASAEMSALALDRAMSFYKDKLATLQAQLAAL